MNCQKLFGCATSIYGLVSTVAALQLFRVYCGLRDSLPPWALDSNLNVTYVDDPGRFAEVPLTVR